MYIDIVTRDITRNPFEPQRAEWVQLAAAAVGIGASLLGGLSAKRKAQKARARQAKRERQEQAYYERAYNQNYLDTKAGRAAITEARDYIQQQNAKTEGTAAVTGASSSATAAAKSSGNKVMSDTMRQIAAQDTARKTRLDEQHQSRQDAYTNTDVARYDQEAQNVTTAAQNASNAMLSAAGAIGGKTGANKVSAAPSSSAPAQVAAPSEPVGLKGSSNNGMVEHDGRMEYDEYGYPVG